jgi:predicted signal transduction protein with EAL and GGDEF domain
VRSNLFLQCLSSEFIPLAEGTGMIHRIGRWVLGQAMADWPQLRPMDNAVATPFVSVNFSAREFSDDSIASLVLAQLAAASMQPEELRIELTQTTVAEGIEDEACAIAVGMWAKAALGVQPRARGCARGAAGACQRIVHMSTAAITRAVWLALRT